MIKRRGQHLPNATTFTTLLTAMSESEPTHSRRSNNEPENVIIIHLLLNVSQKVVYIMKRRMKLLTVPNGGDFSSSHALIIRRTS